MWATPCPRCRTPLPAQARFCGACGLAAPRPSQTLSAQVPIAAAAAADSASASAGAGAGANGGAGAAGLSALGFVPAAKGMPVCLGCGVVAPTEALASADCQVCELDLPAPQQRVGVPKSSPKNQYWVGVQCEFQCRACGHLSPLNHLDVDGSVQCLRCGIEQIFDVDLWRGGLAHAHAVADLAGSDANAWRGLGPAPAQNPFAAVGVGTAVAVDQQSGITIGQDGLVKARSLRVTASPGQPLCERCRAPLTAVHTGPDRLEVACRHCGDHQRYHLPPIASSLCSGVRGVLADEHRIDGRTVEYDPNAAVVAIRCPNCQGPVSVTGKSTVIDCEYCHIALRIPDPLLHRLGHHAPRPLLWWQLLEGPSDLRRKLAKRLPQQPEPRSDPEFDFEPDPDSEPLEIELPPTQPRGFLGRQLVWSIPFLMMVFVGIIWPGMPALLWLTGIIEPEPAASRASGDSSQEQTRSADDGTQSGSQAANDGPPSDRALFTEVRECGCRGRLKEVRAAAVSLAARMNERGTDEQVDIGLEYYLDVASNSYRLDVSNETAPPAQVDKRLLGIALGCHNDIAVIAAGRHATAWSMVDGRLLWSHRLKARYRHGGKTIDSGLKIRCETINARRGSIRIPVGRSGWQRFNVKTGQTKRR